MKDPGRSTLIRFHAFNLAMASAIITVSAKNTNILLIVCLKLSQTMDKRFQNHFIVKVRGYCFV